MTLYTRVVGLISVGVLVVSAVVAATTEEVAPVVAPVVNDEPGVAGVIESVTDQRSLDIKNGAESRSGKRDEKLRTGDSITTDKETVVIRLRGGNELQLAPQSTVMFEEVAGSEGKRDVLLLQKGIVWMLVARGYSLSSPLFLRTPEMAVGISAADLVAEFLPSSRNFSVCVNQGNLKVAPTMMELFGVKRSVFVNSQFRIFAIGQKIGKPKKFKRNLLITYIAGKAKELATNMTTRGSKALVTLARKYDPVKVGEDDITWNLPSAPVASPGAKTSNTGAQQPKP